MAEFSDDRLRDLWQHSLAGDDGAYREFLTVLAELLRGYVERQLKRLGRSQSEAEDIVQEALLAIHAKRHAYDEDVPIIAWAYAITRYKMIDFLRATKGFMRIVPLEDAEQQIGSDAEQLELGVTVRKLLLALPEKMRRPIALMKVQGLSARETAAVTGSSEAATKVNIHRGLKVIAKALR